MCELCSQDEYERRAAVERSKRIAHDLQTLAEDYLGMASGQIKPHSDRAKLTATRAHLAVRDLVNDFV